MAHAQSLAVVLEPKIEGQIPREDQQRLLSAVTEALRSAQLQIVPSADLSAVLEGEPELANCRTEECQDRIGRLLTAQSVISLAIQRHKRDGARRGPGGESEASWRFTASLFDVPIGATGSKETTDCEGCGLEQAAQALGELVGKTVILDAAQPRGTIEVNSEPSGDVLVDNHKLGFTPYKHRAFVGKHEIAVIRTGFKTFRVTVEVRENKRETVDAKLKQGSDKEYREVRGPRPKWRMAAGIGGIGVGAIIAGFGISALAVNGGEIGQPVPPAQVTDRQFSTGGIGGALVGVGVAVIAAGAVLIAIPGEKRLVQLSAGPTFGGAFTNLALSF